MLVSHNYKEWKTSMMMMNPIWCVVLMLLTFCSEHIECNALKLKLHPEDFDVDQVHRFEGMSSTDDNSILYAISSKKGVKGLLVDAYGVYAENISEAMRKKLR